MDVVSLTNSAMRYHKSALDLAVVSEYKNVQQSDISTNFAIIPAKSSLLKIWRLTKNQKEDDSCLEIWRLKKDNENELEMLRKTVGSGASALAVSNRVPQTCGTYAIGYLSGEIKVRQLNPELTLSHHYNAPTSVMHLDYNCTNENLASTHENGSINIYSFTTSVKYDTIKLDGSSTLSRFHLSKKSMLAIASYQGTVTLYDIFGKKPIFKNVGVHTAPCVDLAFSESYLLSCGYDGIINIFDIRKQKPGLQIKNTYGWTTIATSKCGAYFIGGNMKGELVSYDMRNIKKPLSCVRIENGGHRITRVNFLDRGSSAEDNHFVDMAVRKSLEAVEEEIHKSPTTIGGNDSYIEDIVEFQRGRISDFSSSAVNHGTRLSTGSRVSSEFQPNKIEDFEEVSPQLDELFVNKNKRGSGASLPRTTKRRSSLMTPNLQQVREEQPDKENDAKILNTPKNVRGSLTTSTPSIKVNDEDVVSVDESFKSVEDSSKQTNDTASRACNTESNFNMRKEFETLKNDLCEKIRLEVGMLNFDEENRYIKVMSQIVDQRQRLQERVNMIEHCMGMLLNDDFKINRIMELQTENEELRAQNLELSRRSNR